MKNICTMALLCPLLAGVQDVKPAPTLDAEQRAAIVEDIGTKLTEGYIYADKGAKFAEQLAARLAEGAYDSATDRGAFAARLTAEPGAVALLAAAEAEGMRVVVARSADSDFECGAFVKRLAASTGGRGGGRSDHAEGRLPAETDWEKLARG